MSQFVDEVKEVANRTPEEQNKLIEKNKKILKPYLLTAIGLSLFGIVLLNLNLISVWIFCGLAILAAIVYIIGIFTTAINVQTKQKQSTDPGLKKRIYILIAIGLISMIGLIIIFKFLLSGV